jgi:hypothetical protein
LLWRAYPDALFDEVVLIRFQLMLQPVLLLLRLARLALRPCRVQQRGGVLGRDVAEILDERRVQADILALFCFGNGQVVGVGGEIGRVCADVVQAVDASEAGVVGNVRVEVELGRVPDNKLALSEPLLKEC